MHLSCQSASFFLNLFLWHSRHLVFVGLLWCSRWSHIAVGDGRVVRGVVLGLDVGLVVVFFL